MCIYIYTEENINLFLSRSVKHAKKVSIYITCHDDQCQQTK